MAEKKNMDPAMKHVMAMTRLMFGIEDDDQVPEPDQIMAAAHAIRAAVMLDKMGYMSKTTRQHEVEQQS